MKLNIKIIEDTLDEAKLIEKVLLHYKDEKDEVNFLPFNAEKLLNDETEFIDDLFEAILDQKLDAIIVDEKILTWDKKGSHIFSLINRMMPNFPVVMLTAFCEDALENLDVDSDKVYSKKDFMAIKSSFSKLAAQNFLRNVKRIKNVRAKIEVEIKGIEEKLLTIPEDVELLSKLYVLEEKKSKVSPTLESNKAIEALLKVSVDDDLNELEKIEDYLHEQNL